MKGLSFISAGIAILAVVLFFYQQSQINALKKSKGDSEKSTKVTTDGHEDSGKHEHDAEVVHYMTRMQIYHAKLYFSGMNNNTELVKFYLHELEEEMEAIVDAKVSDEGVNVSQNMELFGLPQIKWFEDEMEKKSDFKATFETFTSGSCNGCHQATKHQFLIIKAPEENIFTNQVFETE